MGDKNQNTTFSSTNQYSHMISGALDGVAAANSNNDNDDANSVGSNQSLNQLLGIPNTRGILRNDSNRSLRSLER